MILNLKNVDRCIIAIAERKNIDIEAASELLTSSKLHLVAGDELTSSYSLQLAFLTCYNAGSRIFKGGVTINIPSNTPNLLNLPGSTFHELLSLYFLPSQEAVLSPHTPTICFGRPPSVPNEIEIVCTDWSGGVNMFDRGRVKVSGKSSKISLGGCLAASYALIWAFNLQFGIRDSMFEDSFIYSLWDNEVSLPGLENPESDTPEIDFIPDLWLVGLGHLGQAYLWILANLKGVNKFKVLLQDDDYLGEENLGSQLTSFKHQVGSRKTRVCSSFLDDAGLETQIIEKKFSHMDQEDLLLKTQKVLLTGLDNAATRKQIDPSRFSICLDGATNGHLVNFDSFTFRNLRKSERQPSEIWNDERSTANNFMHKNLSQNFENKGGCGQLTEYGISTPFVGLFGASILISELLKEVLGKAKHSVFTGKLGTPESYVYSSQRL